MNLVIALLSTRSYITAEKIRSSVAGYAETLLIRGAATGNTARSTA